jgi:hypothetical protein
MLSHSTAIVRDGAAQTIDGDKDRGPFNGLIPNLREAFEIFRGQFPGGRALAGELLADEGVLGHAGQGLKIRRH